MKITERIKMIRGVTACRYDFDDYKLIVTVAESQLKAVKIKVWATITDLQLQDSVKVVDFLYGDKQAEKPQIGSLGARPSP